MNMPSSIVPSAWSLDFHARFGNMATITENRMALWWYSSPNEWHPSDVPESILAGSMRSARVRRIPR